MRTIAVITATTLCLGCGDGFGPVPDGKQLSIIDAGTAMSQDFLSTPETVSAGAVLIRYNSYGSSSCNVPAGEDVTREGSVVTITAYDAFVAPGTACTADFGRFNRSVTVTLSPGSIELRLRGVVSNSSAVVVELRRPVVVE